MNKTTKFGRVIRRVCLWIVVAEIVLAYPLYYLVLNAVGPSTRYFDPVVPNAVKGPDGRDWVYLGDSWYVTYTVVRNKINGDCLLKIWRYAEDVGGPTNGKRRLVDYAELRFIGQDEVRRPRWPTMPRPLEFEVNEQGEIQPDKPLLDPGVDHQEIDLFVVARYYCNPLDYVGDYIPMFARYIQGGTKPDRTPHVRVVLGRKP